MFECGNCHENRVNPETGVCASCGMQSAIITGPIDKHTALAGYYRNVLIKLADLAPGQFQQSLGVFGPRTGEPLSDGIPFTRTTLDETCAYLTERDVLCVKIVLMAKQGVAMSIVYANDRSGIQKALREARRFVKKARGRIEITGDPN